MFIYEKDEKYISRLKDLLKRTKNQGSALSLMVIEALIGHRISKPKAWRRYWHWFVKSNAKGVIIGWQMDAAEDRRDGRKAGELVPESDQSESYAFGVSSSRRVKFQGSSCSRIYKFGRNMRGQ
jgi:hypothetical protein